MYNYNYNPYFYKQAADPIAHADLPPMPADTPARQITGYKGIATLDPVTGEMTAADGSEPSMWDPIRQGYDQAKAWFGRQADAIGQGLSNVYNTSAQWIKDNPGTATGIGLAALAAGGAGAYYLYKKNKEGQGVKAASLAKEASYYFYKQAEEQAPATSAGAPAGGDPAANPGLWAQMQGYLNQAGGAIQNQWNQASAYAQQQAQAINNWVAQNPWYAAAIAGGLGLGVGGIGGYMAGAPLDPKKNKR